MLSPALVAIAAFASSSAQAAEPKLIPELRAAIAAAAPGEEFRVYAALSERMTLDDFAGEVEGLPRGARQQAVEETLRGFADARQGDVLALLDELERQGLASDVRQLWITNTVRFRGTPSAIEAVAALPEVAYVGWDPERAPEEGEDACSAPIAPASSAGFTTYWSTGFEGGALPSGATTEAFVCGDVQVTDQYGPKSGAYHLVMSSTFEPCASSCELRIVVDPSSATTATLRFGLLDLNDEVDLWLDVLEASDAASRGSRSST